MSKSKRDWKVFADDIRIAITKICKYTEGKSFDDFIQNEMIIDAVIRNLEVIGEAVKNIPPEVRAKYPDIEWQKMAGLRDILIHEYFGIDNEILWSIITKNLPEAKEKFEKMG